MDRGEEPDGNKPLSKTEQDYRDLQDAIAGRETGRQPRFPNVGARGEAGRLKREKEREQLSVLLSLLRNDPEYAALYNDTVDKVRRAEAASEVVLAQAVEGRNRARCSLGEGQAGASTLPDGTRVYLNENGDARTEDGRTLTQAERDAVIWREGAISYEEYLARKKALDEAQQTIDAIRRYQTDVLGYARDRLSDEENPPTKDELQDIQQAVAAAPQAVKDAMPSSEQGNLAAAQTSTIDAKLPPIGR